METPKDIVMKCGCTSGSQRYIRETDSYVPSCITHNCIEIMEEADIPSLEGRKSRCSNCGREVDSSWHLPFFEYGGHALSAPRWLLTVRNDLLHILWKNEVWRGPKDIKDTIGTWIDTCNRMIKEQSTVDKHYCGCAGWD